MSTQNICFCGEIRKTICGYPVLSGAMLKALQPLYNIVRYYTVLDITQFKDGSQKCIDY